MSRYFTFSLITICLIFSFISSTVADPSKEAEMDYMKPYTGSAELEQMKALSGTWTGMGKMHGEDVPVTIEYKTTAGGSAVIETHGPGTPMEMVSIYYEEDGKLVMKHFCMLKNQPVLGLKDSGENTIEFDYIGGTNMDSSKDMHMHSAVFTFVDDNTMTQRWTPYQDGKAMDEATTITLTRAE
ncbi:MAG: hypothetical protein AAF462_10380 [Thermodesulfobacteriota bacterium]